MEEDEAGEARVISSMPPAPVTFGGKMKDKHAPKEECDDDDDNNALSPITCPDARAQLQAFH